MKRTLVLASLISLAAPASAERVEGTYTVPAGHGLEEPLDVPLGRARLNVIGDKVMFDYRLPKELDGPTPQRFRLEGQIVDGTMTLQDARGDQVTATCETENAAFVCLMKYNQPFQVDAAGARRYLEATGASDAEIAKLQRGSDSLQHQAAGIVTIPRG